MLYTVADIDKSYLLGKGVTGEVLPTKDGLSAFKKFDNYDDYNENDCINGELLKEVTVMRSLCEAPFTQHVTNELFDLDCLGFFMKRYKSSLAERIAPNRVKTGVDFSTAKKIMYQLLVSLYHADQKLIIHGDLKPENILIDEFDNVVIADWGHSKIDKFTASKEKSLGVQTLYYRSPEILLGDTSYSTKIDIWSVGLIFFDLINGGPLIKNPWPEIQFREICAYFGFPDHTSWKKVEFLPLYESFRETFENKDISRVLPSLGDKEADIFILNLLRLNPEERFSASQALNDPFFDDMRDEEFEEISSIEKLNRLPSFTYSVLHKKYHGNIVKACAWIYEVCKNVDPAVYFLAIDLFKHAVHMHKMNEYHLLATSVIYLSSTLIESSGVNIDMLLIITQSAFTKDKIHKMTNMIYKNVNCNIYRQSYISYINCILDDCENHYKIKLSDKTIISLIIDATKDYRYTKFSKLNLVLGAIFLLNGSSSADIILQYCQCLEKTSRSQISDAMKFLSEIRLSQFQDF